MTDVSISTIKLGLFTLAFAALTPIAPSFAISFYSLTDLGTIFSGTTDTRATAINNLGQVVGRETGLDGGVHSFVWKNGTITQLPEYAAADPSSTFVDLIARSVNDSGVIAGTVDPTVNGADAEQGLLWKSNGSGGYDGSYYGNYPNSLEKYFRDINNSNQVAGNYVLSRGANGVSQAYYWDESTDVTLLPTLGGNVGQALGINNLGQLVGNVAKSSTDRTITAALWQKDINGNFTLQNIGSDIGGLSSNARDINLLGQVVGQYTPATGQTVPFLWQNGVKTDLGSLGGLAGNALGINSKTQIVGFSNTVANTAANNRAFLWEQGQIFDLNNYLTNATGWQLLQATGINDRGQIVGYGRYTDGNGQTQTRAFLLQSVPESDSVLGILALGCLGLGRFWIKAQNQGFVIKK